MTLDLTVNLGNILVALFAIISFAIAFTKIGGRIDLLTQRVASMEETVKGHRDINTRVAVIETRQASNTELIATLQKDVHDLRHGRGFVQNRPGGIDGEYP